MELLLQALGIFQRATPDQLWKLTCPENQHDKLTWRRPLVVRSSDP
ncbi:hypothetical protein [Streptomyces lavendofoliae]|nr:hypothetical protein [Streptomyces lavendofoliae]